MIAFILPALTMFGQVSYEDVAVVINENDNHSVEIGEYFAQKRNIPQENLIYIQCPSVEIIDSAGFVDIREQIEEKMASQGLMEKINYLVTTKGLPFNVRRSESCAGLDGVRYCSSFDSELTLLFSDWSDQIIGNYNPSNPYYEKSEYFDRNNFGIFLVTRLDAYTVADVKTLIDRSGPGVEVAKSIAQIIVDFSFITEPAMTNLFTEFVEPAVNHLLFNDWHVIFDPSEEMVTDQSDVLGYYSINYQPADKDLNFTWLRGSLSEIVLSTGNLTFYKEQNVFNELSVPDLLEEGATSSCTYANSMFFGQLIQLPILFERYYDDGQQPGFNLAESYFMAMPFLSNHYLVIGDPKTSLTITQSQTQEIADERKLVLYPVPARDRLVLAFMSPSDGSYAVRVSDIAGRIVLYEDIYCAPGMIKEEMDISRLSGGVYFITLTGHGKEYAAVKFIKAGNK